MTEVAAQPSEPGQLRSKRPWRDLEAFNRERFQAELARLKVDIRVRSAGTTDGWASVATEHVEYAERFFRDEHIDAAWSALKAASRELLEAYDWTELELEADRVRRESAEKLHDWRKAAVDDVLGEPPPTSTFHSGDGAAASITIAESRDHGSAREEADSAPTGSSGHEQREVEALRKRVRMTRVILDDDADNTHRKLRLVSQQLLVAALWLAALLPSAVVVIFVCTRWGWEPSAPDPLFADPKSVVVVMTLGAIGGATSGLFTLLYPGTHLRIPDVKAQRYLILFRPVIGASAALIVVAILRSGLGGVRMDPEAALAAAFVAGFAERTVSRAVAASSAAIAK